MNKNPTPPVQLRELDRRSLQVREYLRRILVATATLFILAAAAPAVAAEAAGRWEGAIQLPNAKLDIVVSLSPGEEGSWAGTIDIPAQGLRGFTLGEVRVEGARVHFEMPAVPGRPTFEGEITGDSIAGTFTQGGQSFPFALTRGTGEAPVPPPAASGSVPGEGLVGEWLGALDAGPTRLRLALSVTKDSEGSLSAILESVDQGSKIPVTRISMENRRVQLSLEAIGGSFVGTMNADGSAIEGRWAQGGSELPLTFNRQQSAFSLNRPQHPQGPFPYAAHEVSFRSKAGDIRLAGTFIVPEGEGPFPAVAMVTGSGPQDRDETVMGHKPFLVIADALARRGIASLRFDDRGAGASEGDHFGSTLEEFAADARAAVAWLHNRDEVNGDAVGILGHSEGGLIAPMVAATDESVDFLVLLAPPGEPMPALLQRQSIAQLRLMQLDEALMERAMEALAEDLALVADTSLSNEALATKLRALAERRIAEYSAEERVRLAITPESVERGIQMTTMPWFRSLMGQDPAVHLRRVEVPVLALFGEKDFQVDAEINAQALRAALKAGRNTDFEIEIFPRLNHLFQHAETGGIEEYARIEETFAPVALRRIEEWILARSASPATAAGPAP
jgi:uncharacterized protein